MAFINLRHFVGKVAYPIGSIICMVDPIYPGDFWGGTWLPLVTNTFLHGANTSFPVKEGINTSDGGSKDKLNIAHTHPAITHDHSAYASASQYTGVCTYLIAQTTVQRRGWLTQSVDDSRYAFTMRAGISYLAFNAKTDSKSVGLASSGSSGTGMNMPPYKYVHMWIRTGW